MTQINNKVHDNSKMEHVSRMTTYRGVGFTSLTLHFWDLRSLWKIRKNMFPVEGFQF